MIKTTVASILGIITTCNIATSQLYVNTDFAVNNGGIIKVQNNYLNVGNNGNFENAGNVDVDYNYINNGTTTGRNSSSGIYYIGGDWENNNNFIADNSTVHLYNSDKLISGTSPTDFYNLKLTGGSKLMTVNSSAVWLDLGTDHLNTGDNVMLVNNTDPTSLIYTTGYVSSKDDGHLQRKTNSKSTYSFPLGTNYGDFRLRPIDFIPKDNTDNTFGARLANNNATSDGYSLEEKSELVGELNPLYYHHLYQNSGNSKTDVRFHYDNSEDEVTETIAHWINDWNIESNVRQGGSNGGFETLLLSNFNNFSTKPFILASENNFIYIPNTFTPNNDGKNDFLSINFEEEKMQDFSFLVFDRWGNIVFEKNTQKFYWNGTSNGEILPDGTYIWKMNYKLIGSTKLVEKLGHINILK